jgi:hypothetical protein
MANKTYLELLKDPRWQKKRLTIMDRDNWTCRLCGDTSTTLNVHHVKYQGKPWEAEDRYLMTLCERCHKDEEQLKIDNPVIKELSTKGGMLATTLVDFMVQISYVRWNDPDRMDKILIDFREYNDSHIDSITDFLSNG